MNRAKNLFTLNMLGMILLAVLSAGCLPNRQNMYPSQGGFNPLIKPTSVIAQATPTVAPRMSNGIYPDIETQRAMMLLIIRPIGGLDVATD